MSSTYPCSYHTQPQVPSRAPPHRRRATWHRFAFASTGLLAIIGMAESAAAQIIRTTITPGATAIRWKEELGLEDKALYGGSLDFDFDRWVALQGYFFTNTGVETAADKLGVSPDDAADLGDQRLRLNSYGANVKLNLGVGTVVPHLDFGGGVIEFRPDNGVRSRQIAVNLGGGLRIAATERVYLDLYARDAMFRINRFALFALPAGGALPADPDADELRHNLVVGAGLGIPFGPSRAEATGPIGPTRWGLRGLSFALEPLVGQLNFDTRNIADQSLAGVRAGFDIGSLVGIRGFYWRGVGDNFTQTEPIQSWGGEAQFRFNSGVGLTPFVVVGGGQLDFTSEFRDRASQRVSDETSFIAGGGLALPLGERFGLELTARDYMIGERAELEDVASTNDLSHNWLWSAGLRVNVGGQRGSALARERASRQERLQRELAMERARLDSLDRELAAERRRAARPDTIVVMNPPRAAEARGQPPTDTMRVESVARAADTTRDVNVARARDTTRAVNLAGAADTTRARDTTGAARAGRYQSERVVSVPVPTEGELYVRYGPAREARTGAPLARDVRGPVALRESDTTAVGAESMVSRSELREMVRDAVRTEGMDARLDAMRDELTRSRIDAMQDELTQARLDAMRGEPASRTQTTRQPVTAARGANVAPTTSRTPARRPVIESGGEVERRAVPTRAPVVKERVTTPADSARMTPSDTMQQALTGEIRSLLDSIRAERRVLDAQSRQRSARADSMLVAQVSTRVDSIITARLAQQDEARRAAEAAARQREADERSRATQPQPVRQGRTLPRMTQLTVYGGANVSDGVQGISGFRVDLGNLWRMYEPIHVVPELAFGWGEGARSTMFAGNLQYGLPVLRIGGLPNLTPQIEGGLGILSFSEEVSGHDGTDVVVNLGYGVGIDLWRRSSGRSVPVLVVAHQGVDLFSLNRILVGARWSF